MELRKKGIFILDDHKLFREMWRKVFAGHAELEIIGDCGEFNEGMEMIKAKRPDFLFLDINIQDASGIDAIPIVRKNSPGTKIIIVSMHNKVAYAKKILQLGAKAYVTKNSSYEEIFMAIEEVQKGNQYLCTEVKDLIARQVMNEEEEVSFDQLSLREIEIVKAIVNGLSSKEIAVQLDISVRTVDTHRHNILKKLRLNSSASLVNYVNSKGIIL
jgi:DNA-binding NarL/FixJ family response regulator